MLQGDTKADFVEDAKRILEEAQKGLGTPSVVCMLDLWQRRDLNPRPKAWERSAVQQSQYRKYYTSYCQDTTINAISHTTKPIPRQTAMHFAISRLRLIVNKIDDTNAIASRPALTCPQISTIAASGTLQ